MDGGLVQGLCTLGGLIIINIVAVAYSYGKTTQKVNDFCRRLKRVERKLGINGNEEI